jgi:acyl-CoA reductase-like NAD-dependent aldehyde dehydrogenase
MIVLRLLLLQADVDDAVIAARAAIRRGSPWRKMDPSKKGALMYRLTELMAQNLTYLAVSCIVQPNLPTSKQYCANEVCRFVVLQIDCSHV